MGIGVKLLWTGNLFLAIHLSTWQNSFVRAWWEYKSTITELFLYFNFPQNIILQTWSSALFLSSLSRASRAATASLKYHYNVIRRFLGVLWKRSLCVIQDSSVFLCLFLSLSVSLCLSLSLSISLCLSLSLSVSLCLSLSHSVSLCLTLFYAFFLVKYFPKYLYTDSWSRGSVGRTMPISDKYLFKYESIFSTSTPNKIL